jgi:hypothetical protein
MAAKRFLTALIVTLSLQLNAQQTLYKVQWDDFSSFSISGGTIESGAWRVANDSCTFTSAVFALDEDVVSGIDVNLTAMVDGKMSADEKIYGTYFVNGNIVKMFEANGSQFVGDYKRTDHISAKPKQRVMVKISMVSGSKDKSWVINSEDINISVTESSSKKVATVYNGRTVKIVWNFDANNDCNYFIVERSKNGHDFAQIGLVKAEQNNRNSFQLIDNGMASGVNYYRVKIKNFKGEAFQLGNISMLNTQDDLTEARN